MPKPSKKPKKFRGPGQKEDIILTNRGGTIKYTGNEKVPNPFARPIKKPKSSPPGRAPIQVSTDTVKFMKPPEKGGKPKRITTKGKPGDTGPGGATPARDRNKKGKKK